MITELIKVSHSGDKPTISAQELYLFLGMAPSQWSRWSKKNIENNEFVNRGEDWEGFDLMSSGNKSMDYEITLDFAKRISMMAKTERGEQARSYFIECEKKAQSNQVAIPQTLSEALMLAANLAKEGELQKLQITELQPKAEYYDTVANTNNTFDLACVAKNLDLPFGRNILFEKLRQKGILTKENMPYQNYVDAGYFKVKQMNFVDKKDRVYIKFQTRVTDKGLKWLKTKITTI